MTIARRRPCAPLALGVLVLVSGCKGDAASVDGGLDLLLMPGCGNGILEDNEECDRGRANSDSARDGCRTSCRKASCGDHVQDTAEGCDDGNGWGGDGCTPICTVE